MKLESNRLRLEEVNLDDIENIHRLHSIPEVEEFNTLGLPENIEQTKEAIRPIIDDKYAPQRKLFFFNFID